MFAFIVQNFSFTSGCPKVGSPCRDRVWILVKAICVTKYYRTLVLDLEVYIQQRNSFLV